MAILYPPRHIAWSVERLDLSDPFQRRWYLRQVLLHGRAPDIQALNLAEVRRELDALQLPAEVHSLWRRFFDHRAEG